MKKALLINLLFSGFSGILLLLFPRLLASVFNLPSTMPFLIIGLALLFFSITILYEVKRQRPIAILWIIVQDILWVLASIYVVVFNPFNISLYGKIIIAVVAIIVLLMALQQSAALMKIDSGTHKDEKKFQYSRIIKATKTDVWKVISDVGNYHKVAPNIDEVKIIKGEGKGMVRSCSHGKESWTETCSLWKEEEIFSFIVDTSAPDYPYPLKTLKGTWQVQEVDIDLTKITVTFEFSYKYKILNVLAHPLLRLKFKEITDDLLDNWQGMLEKKKVAH